MASERIEALKLLQLLKEEATINTSIHHRQKCVYYNRDAQLWYVLEDDTILTKTDSLKKAITKLKEV